MLFKRIILLFALSGIMMNADAMKRQNDGELEQKHAIKRTSPWLLQLSYTALENNDFSCSRGFGVSSMYHWGKDLITIEIPQEFFNTYHPHDQNIFTFCNELEKYTDQYINDYFNDNLGYNTVPWDNKYFVFGCNKKFLIDCVLSGNPKQKQLGIFLMKALILGNLPGSDEEYNNQNYGVDILEALAIKKYEPISVIIQEILDVLVKEETDDNEWCIEELQKILANCPWIPNQEIVFDGGIADAFAHIAEHLDAASIINLKQSCNNANQFFQ